MNVSRKIIIFFSFFFAFFVFFSHHAVSAQEVPSPACLGSCPTTPPSISPIEETSPVDTTLTVTQSPCVESNVTANARGYKKKGGNDGLLNILLQLILILLQYLAGGGTTSLPTPTLPQPTHIPPTPCAPSPTVVLPTEVIATLIPTASSSQNPTTAPTTAQPTIRISQAPSPLPSSGATGLIYPPNLIQSTTMPGYYQLTPTSSPNNGYTTLSCSNKLWGARELVGFLYTVAQKWKQKYPQGYIRVADMNGTGHEPGHTTGESVDLDATTNGTDCVADYIAAGLGGNCGGTKYNREATIELAKIMIDTGMLTRIIYLDQAVNAAMDEYARSKGATRNVSLERPAHDNHFHVDLKIPKLATWAPSC